MGCDSPLKGWRNLETGGIQFRRENAYEKMEVACGQCLGCRLDYRRMWGMRIVHEAAMWEHKGGNCFITLTYDDENVPDDWSLDRAHWRNFMKRLRKRFDPQKIRFFAAGEYGVKCKHGIDVAKVGCPLCKTGRPHFHACLFNCWFDDLEIYQTDGGIDRYTSNTLSDIWGKGFVDVGELNYGSACYTAGYVVKKVKGMKADDHYMTVDMDGEITWIQPEFVVMSRGNASRKGQRCGIGAGWYEKFKDDVFPSDEVPIPGVGVKKGVPRYYSDILKDENPEMYEKMKAARKLFMAEHRNEYTEGRLMSKHICKKTREKDRCIE